MEQKKYTGNPTGHGRMHGPGMRRGEGGKARDFKGTWKKLIAYCSKYTVAILIAIVCAAGGTIFTLVGPDKLSELTGVIARGLKGGIDMQAVAAIGRTLILFYICSIILSFAQHFIMTTIAQILSRQMRRDITQKINRLPMDYYNRTSHGDILSRVTNDVDMISQSFNQSVGMLVSAITLFLGSLFMMLITNVLMTLTAIAAIFIGFMLMRLITSHSQKYFARQQRHLGELNGHIEEMYSGHTVIKAYNGEAHAQETFDALNGDLRDSAFKAQCLAGLMQPMMIFIGNLGYVAVCVAGAVLTMHGQIGFEVIVAFMMYVRFGYEPGKTIIHDFSAQAKPGQKIAIVGPTGAGKTTLVNLLMRFYEIEDGDIRIDGVSTRSVPREDVHSQFCMVLQDTWLFEGTIRENLIYCTPNVSDAKMEQACKAVGLDHFIRTLPHGYDTVLNDQLNLSQGQKQQLTIARAMIADRPMLILDEATSSVDTRTEMQIQKAMDALMENRTSFVIAHRLSTVKNADLILVLKDGDVIESGTHEELLAQNGFYAELYNSQFEQAS